MRILIENFQRIRHLDIEATTPITLIAGHNEAGKSSFSDALRFALLGDSARIEKKGDYGHLVTDGARSGSVKVGNIERNVRDGKGSLALENVAYPYALGTARFADLAPADRRRLLMTVTGVRPTPDLVRAKLTERGHSKERIEAILPMLRSGWDAAETDAARRATEARGAWKAITGEAYGDKKAEGWEAPVPAGFDPDAAAVTKAQISAIEDDRSKLLELRGQQREREQRAQKLTALRETAAQVPALEQQRSDLEDQLSATRSSLEALRKKQTNAGGPPQPCPACGADLCVSASGEIQAHKKRARGAKSPKSLEQEIAAREAEEEALLRRVVTAERHLNEAQAAAEMIKDESSADACDVDAAAMDETLRDMDTRLAALRRELEAWERAERERDTAAEKTRAAAAHHASAQAWVQMRADVGPAGIPAELLSQALGPVNDRLRATAEVSQWDQVMIADDMTITVGGRIYALCSESARWRADAALHEAIAALAGVQILVLDRIDVLDLENRVKLVRWLSQLAGDQAWADGGTIFALGTFKSPPTGLPEGVFAVHWIEHGELSPTHNKQKEAVA